MKRNMNSKRTMANQRNTSGRVGSRRNNKKKTTGSFTKFLLMLMVLAAVVCVILFSNKNIASADETGNNVTLTKYYKTITIEKGDTLWSIANEYMSGEYRTTKEYVKELRSMNGLHSDNITSGEKLVVAYFAE